MSELAPDLEFDDDGMPKLDGMGGLGGLPDMGMGDDCTIM